MTDEEILERVTRIAYSVPVTKEMAEEAMNLCEQVQDPRTKMRAETYLEMIAMSRTDR